MDIKKITSRAPTRIDLAGGTVDIWPLYLFLKDPITLNLGIDLFAEATLELSPRISGEVTLRSEDQNQEIQFPWEKLEEIAKTPGSIPKGLELHYKLLRYFYERLHRQTSSSRQTLQTIHQQDFLLRTRARSPAGAGLGGSSTLSIAMIGALSTWCDNALSQGGAHAPIDPQKEGEKFIEIVRDVETTVIQVPAGLQDYYGAMYGGLQCLKWEAGTHQREHLSKELIPELEDRLLLFYSGQSRNSGINNWALFKGFIDQQDGIREKFAKISQATHRLKNALQARDWEAAGQAIAEEWETRKTLAKGITTPEIDQAFLEAKKLAPVSGKVCGAGGGGCFFIYLPIAKSELKKQIQEIFTQYGMRPLEFRGVPHGLEVQVTRG